MFDLRYLPGVATLRLDYQRCTGCRKCVEVCPHAVFEVKGNNADIIDLDACMECGACAMNCPEEALSVNSGVGCAAGIIIGAIRGTEPTCDCSGGTDCC